MMNRPTNETALSAYVAALAEIRETLALLTAHADDHFGVAPEEVHWGHVGNTGFVNERLNEVAGFLGLHEYE